MMNMQSTFLFRHFTTGLTGPTVSLDGFPSLAAPVEAVGDSASFPMNKGGVSFSGEQLGATFTRTAYSFALAVF